MPTARRGLRILLALAVIFAAAAFILWPTVHTHLQAVSVLKTISNEPVPNWLAKLTTEPVAQHDLTLQTEAGPVRARVYSPTAHPNAPGFVVFHGVHHLGMEEPRMIAFARAMASSGLNVLTPELPDISDYHINARSIAVIGASAKWFAHDRNSPVGVLGLSFSGGLSLVAASDPAYANSMRFVFAIGAQDSMPRVADYYRTGRDRRPDGTTEILPPHEYGPLVLEYEHLEDFVPTTDIEPIRNALHAHLYEDPKAEYNAFQSLTPQQDAEAHGLMNTNAPNTQQLLTRNAALRHDEMQSLSPEQHLSSLTVPVFLLHGEADNVIPAAETQWLAHDIPHKELQAALISPLLSHVDMQKNPTIKDEWNLVHFMAGVLRKAER